MINNSQQIQRDKFRKSPMKDGYLLKKPHFHKHLPNIHTKPTSLFKQVPNEKTLLQEIKDIDDSLHNKEFSYHLGLLFSDEITPKLIDGLYSSIKKQTSITQHGFYLWMVPNNHDEIKRLSSKVETFNERMLNLSKKNLYQFQLKKYENLIKSGHQRWSLYKRVEKDRFPTSKVSQLSKNTQIESTITNSTVSKNQYSSMIAKDKKVQLLSGMKSNSVSKPRDQGRVSYLNKRKMITEIEECPEDNERVYSKPDLKKMLLKQKQRLVFIWLPPTTYPQFNGMFRYLFKKEKNVCYLKKYFFFKHSLSKRFFYSLFENLSFRENTHIDCIQLTTHKIQYLRVFEPLGWKMKSMDGVNRIRIKLNRYEI